MTDSSRCPACGKAIHPGDRFCAVCGEQLDEPGFVLPAASAPPAPAAMTERQGDAWPSPPASSAADAAWMPPGRIVATAAASDRGDAGSEARPEPSAVTGDPVAAERPPTEAGGTEATAAMTPGWAPATATTMIAAPPIPLRSPADDAAPDKRPTEEEAADDGDPGNWFVTTAPSTLLMWGVIATIGGLLLGAIGQVDPTDTLVILAFLIVPLGLLLLLLALVCWIVQKATGRR